MKNCAVFLISISICMLGCGQNHSRDSTGLRRERLTCLILGYDSVIYYTGASEQMQDVHMGKITDTAFVGAMFQKIKSRNLAMVLKPGGGGDMLTNFQGMVVFANNYGVYRRSVDSGDANEDKAFGFSTPPMVKAAMRGEDPPPLKLMLPRDEPDTSHALANFPKASQLVILISGSDGIYAYIGGDIDKGKKYSYPEIADFLKARKSDKNFSVLIKPSENATYKNTVNMLDVLQTQQIQHYALVDITKEEENYLRRIE
jgi:biopolymer transport protein ExbD